MSKIKTTRSYETGVTYIHHKNKRFYGQLDFRVKTMLVQNTLGPKEKLVIIKWAQKFILV